MVNIDQPFATVAWKTVAIAGPVTAFTR